jgi:hypothetical protein
MHGHGSRYWTPDNKYIGEFKNGKIHGKGTYTSTNNIDFTGTWEAGDFLWKGNKFTLNQLDKLARFQDIETGLPPENKTPGTNKKVKNSAADWYRYSDPKYTDNNYYYQKRGNEWFAKNVNTNQEFNISVIPKYQKTTVNLNLAIQKKNGAKLTAV